MKCENCGIDFESNRADAKYCSPKCRKEAFNKRSVGTDKSEKGTDNIIMAERIIPEQFSFTITQRPGAKPGDENWNENKAKIRKAIYWYDIPLAAVPVIKKGWPDMPEYMNGRQYFLWWKNDFIVNEDGTPTIHNPFPFRTDVKYEMGGEGARRWGA